MQFVFDNKLLALTHFGEYKTKCLLFSWDKILPELNIIYDINNIKHYHMIRSFGSCLDVNLGGQFMAMKSLRKIDAWLQFLFRINEFLTPELRRLVRYSLFQPYF